MSRSPAKKPENTVTVPGYGELQENINPFEKKGLQRSPTSSQVQAELQDSLPGVADPFKKKTGLRRSPVSSQAEPEQQDSLPGVVDPFKKKSGLRRSPISSQPIASFEALSQPEVSTIPMGSAPLHTAQPITVERLDELALAPRATQGRSFEAERPIVLNQGQKVDEPIKAPRRRVSQVAELVREDEARQSAGFSNTYNSQAQEDAAVTSNKTLQRPLFPAKGATQSNQPQVEEPEQPAEDDTPPVSSIWLVRDDSAAENVTQPYLPQLKDPEQSVREAAQSDSSSWLQDNSATETAQPRQSEPQEPEQHVEEVPVPATSSQEPDVSKKAASLSSNRMRLSPQEPELQTEKYTPSRKTRQVEVPEFEFALPEVFQSGGSPRPEPELPSEEITRSVNARRLEREEPELPPTPTQRGIPDPIVTTPPTGIHDTPSKRGRRSKSLGNKLKSSPLKPRDPPPSEPAKEKWSPEDSEPIHEPEPELEHLLKPEKSKRRKSARFLVPEDPYAAKKKARDDLLKELQQLQADVALANQENERLRLHQESGKRRPTAAPNPDELLALLKRATEKPLKPKPKPTSIFKSIGQFLPFSSRRRTQPISSSDLEKPLPSHLPIAVDDPLPYLQAFSPLNYTSSIILLPQEQIFPDSTAEVPEQPTLQKHLINASHPTGLFAARLTMIVNSSTLSITDIEIPNLDASSEQELGPFVRQRATGNETLGKDINVICWAMGRWVEVAIKRAAFWCAIEADFSTPKARLKSLQKHSKNGKRKRQDVNGEDEVDAGDKQTWTRRQLLPHMGRTSIEIVSEEVELRVEWRIGFDWTGEAESAISAWARVPKSC